MSNPDQHTENYVAIMISDLKGQLAGMARTIQRRGRGAMATEREREQIAQLREQIAYLRAREREESL